MNLENGCGGQARLIPGLSINRFGDITVLDLLRAWCGFTPDLDEDSNRRG